MPRLPAFLLLNCPPMSESVTPSKGAVATSRAARPPTGDIAASLVSGFSFHSTLILSAPNAARMRVPPAEAKNHEKSRILMPCKAKGAPRAEIFLTVGVYLNNCARPCPCDPFGDGACAPAFKASVFLGALSNALNSALCCPNNGARLPACQAVAVLNHLLVG